jgi:tetratricopeptide (TPR) repeat protein
MAEERRDRIEQLFEAALEQPEVHREGWLAVACGADVALLADVRGLLAAHALAEEALSASRHGWSRDVAPAPDMAGPYRLIRELGRGGMGTVHIAERDDGVFRRRVAVKLLHTGVHAGGMADELIARFLAERQILAALDHPNIGRLLDGGLTATGRPYLVMEYIDGVPLDRYLENQGADVEARLRLFSTVARAVHYAHGRLVVHRDLKPSNVLVTPDGVAKLLDFGIAKILDPAAVELNAPAPHTRTGLRLMTPAYASPEQFRGEPASTANDIWSLGVMLYELLAGRRPFLLDGLSPAAAERVIAEEDPPRPSQAAASPRLRRRLSGDLDRIVLTALRKEPARRYGSAEQLADDIERHLTGRPISARSDSAVYRARKFMLRHRVTVAAAAVLVALLAAYAVSATVQERRVRLALTELTIEAERAERVNELLLSLLEPGRPVDSPDDTATRDALRRALASAEQSTRHPRERAELLHAIGLVHHRLGDVARAAPLLEEALALQRGQRGSRHLAVSGVLTDLGDTYRMLGRFEPAERALREALGIERELLGSDHLRIARNLNDLALVLRDAGDYAAAEPLAREGLAMRQRLLGPDDPAVAASLNDLAALLRRRGAYAEALPLYREALAIRRRAYPGDHWLVAETINNVGAQLKQMGDIAAAEPVLREAVAMYRRVYGNEHPYTAVAAGNLAALLVEAGQLAEARTLLEYALKVQRRAYGDAHQQVTIQYHRLGLVAMRQGDLDEAERYFRDALEFTRRGHAPDHPYVARDHHALGALHRARGRADSAETHLLQALRIRRAKLGRHVEVAETLVELGGLATQRGDSVTARQHLREAYEIQREVLVPQAAALRSTSEELATLGAAIAP